jgi:hypothetical protein
LLRKGNRGSIKKSDLDIRSSSLKYGRVFRGLPRALISAHEFENSRENLRKNLGVHWAQHKIRLQRQLLKLSVEKEKVLRIAFFMIHTSE